MWFRTPTRHAGLPGSRLPRRLLAVALACIAAPAAADLSLKSQFNPSNTAGICGIAADTVSTDVWVHGCSSATVDHYTAAGVFVGTVPRPGESANDVDIDFSLAPLMLDTTAIPSGTLLFFNGESGTADVYGINTTTPAVLDTLVSDFGSSHVVGGAHHPDRGTLFMVHDRQTSVAADRNLIAEVDPVTGDVLGSFAITAASATFTVNFGDIDVCPGSGNLLVVSSDETATLELTPAGVFVALHPLPAGVAGLSGIAVSAINGAVVWVSGEGGVVWELEASPCDNIFKDSFETE